MPRLRGKQKYLLQTQKDLSSDSSYGLQWTNAASASPLPGKEGKNSLLLLLSDSYWCPLLDEPSWSHRKELADEVHKDSQGHSVMHKTGSKPDSWRICVHNKIKHCLYVLQIYLNSVIHLHVLLKLSSFHSPLYFSIFIHAEENIVLIYTFILVFHSISSFMITSNTTMNRFMFTWSICARLCTY